MKKLCLITIIIALGLSITNCSDDIETINLPIVETLEISNITSVSASYVGKVINDGGSNVSEKGVCWSVGPNPTVSSSEKINNGQGIGMFDGHLDNLLPDRIYYVRAYAINEIGISYGDEINFTTLNSNTIIYKVDGRTVKYGDPLPLILDITNDGEVDFTVFIEATANSHVIRLYAGINPIGNNQIISGPTIEENYLSMGFLVAKPIGSVVDYGLEENQRWISDHGALVIRNSYTDGEIIYEGNWSNSAQIVGIQHYINGVIYFGWLRLEFNKDIEVLTLIDFAYNSIPNQPIIAGNGVN